MRAVISLTIKDLRLLFRDRMGLFFIIAFPIIMGVAFGLMYSSVGRGASKGGMKVGLIDNDNSEISKKFVENLNEIKAIELQHVEQANARELVLKGRLLAYITIPSGFGKTAGVFWMEPPELEVGVDPSRAAEAAMLQGMLMQAVGGLIQDRMADTDNMREQIGKTRDELAGAEDINELQRGVLLTFFTALDSFMGSYDTLTAGDDDEASEAGGEPANKPGLKFELARIKRVDVSRPPSEHEQTVAKLRSAWDISFPAAIMWGVMGCVAGFAISIVRERSQGTLPRLTMAPISRTHILAGKAGACFISALGVITVMMIIGRGLGIQLARLDLLILASLCIAACFVGLMMLMSVMGKSEEAVGGAGWAVIVLLCMFGGGMMPLAFMPPFMKTISNFSPVKWGILAMEGAVWRGFTLTDMLAPCGVLLAIGAVSFTAGAAIFARQDA